MSLRLSHWNLTNTHSQNIFPSSPKLQGLLQKINVMITL